MVDSLSRQVGQYTLLRALSSAADTTEVYLAKTAALGHGELCAVKLPEATGAERARRAMTINHQTLVSVLDVGQEAGAPFYTMEYIEGRSLAAVLTRCAERAVALPIEAGLFAGIQICRALTELSNGGPHAQTRRAVSPGNILISFDGVIKLGMASPRQIDAPGSRDLAYVAPEETEGDGSCDQRADIYALGVLLWELLVGHPLHLKPPRNAAELIAGTRSAVASRPSSVNPEIEADLDTLVCRAIALDPRDRFDDVEHLRSELATALVSREPSFDAEGMADLMLQLFGEEVPASRAESQRLLFGTTEEDGAPFRPEVTTGPDSLPGQVLGRRYKVLERIGEGGMGAVYLAKHVDIGRLVAIKILHAAYSTDTELVKRFRQEARAAAEIGHPNIVEVTDFGTTQDSRIYFVMEYLEGVDLAQVMSETRRLPMTRSIDITLQICRALHTAHEAGIVHRDLKPENIFLVNREGRGDFVKILDFGVAINIELVRQGGSRLTTPGMAMGTPEYMAPEQAAGQSIDRRIDVYATSVMLFEMLTGRLPHEGATLMALLNKKATEPAASPSRYRTDLPEPVVKAIMCGLEAKPEKRFQTMEEMARAVEATMRSVTGPHRQAASPGALDITEVSPGVRPLSPLSASGPTATISPIMPDDDGLDDTTALMQPNNRGSWAPGVVVLLLAIAAGGLALAWHLKRPSTTEVATTPDLGAPPPDLRRTPKPQPKKNARTRRKKPPPKPRPKLTEEGKRLHLEWAKRAAAGGRYFKPRGDNVRDLLARIERDFPGDTAVASFRTAICKDKVRRARRHLRRKRQQQADRDLSICIAIHPGTKKARYALANLRLAEARTALRRRRYAQASRSAQRAIKALPTSVSARELLGDMAYKRRKYKSAVAYYQAALEQKVSRARARKLRRKYRRAKRRAK